MIKQDKVQDVILTLLVCIQSKCALIPYSQMDCLIECSGNWFVGILRIVHLRVNQYSVFAYLII